MHDGVNFFTPSTNQYMPDFKSDYNKIQSVFMTWKL